MVRSKSKISIVIPVYNEAESLAECLRAIVHQSVQPYEVIVVDNNSSDSSALVASSFPNVKLMQETKQGVIHARTSGFNAASGSVIARIDADTIIPVDWVKRVDQIMSNDDIAAVSGSPDYYDFLFPSLTNFLDRMARKFLEGRLKDRMFLHGSNMAIRTRAWHKVANELCVCRGIHEDLDLAIHLQETGLTVIYDQSLVAGISVRRLNNDFNNFINYTLVSPRTYAAHQLKCQRYMYPVVFFTWAAYFPAHLAYLSFDPAKRSFSFRYLIDSKLRESRIDPTINVV